MWKKWQKIKITIISKPYAHSHTIKKKTYAKFQNDRSKTVGGVELTRGIHCLYTEGEQWLSSQCGKVTKYVLTSIPKPHAQPHTLQNICKISKRSVQNCKRSCAHKRYPLSIYWEWKMTKFIMWKKWQKFSNNYTKTTCTSSYHEENTCKVSK